MPASLPEAVTLEQFRAARGDETLLRPGVDSICERHRLQGGMITRFADGSLPVYALGDSFVLKLYPPVFRSELDIESRVLEALRGRLPIPTPGVEATGDLAALHAVRDPVLETLGPPDWDELMRVQRASCVERQRAKGLDEHWLAQIPSFLESVPLATPARRVLLHTEVMREHLLVDEGADGFAFTGLFDFEPAMRGAPEYEFAAVGVFVSCGDGAMLRRLLLAYGYQPAQLDEAFARRMLAYALLHRYSNVRWYLARLPPPVAPTLEALAMRGWGFE